MSTAGVKQLEAAVKRHRKANGLSQQELAAAIGVPYSTIYRLELGEARRSQRLKRLAGGLGGGLIELVVTLADPGIASSSAEDSEGKGDDLSDECLRKVERYVERIEKQE